MSISFVVNRCLEDRDKDELHSFQTIEEMRSFIDEDPCHPMELTIYKDGKQFGTLPHAMYWQHNKHPTLEQLIGEPEPTEHQYPFYHGDEEPRLHEDDIQSLDDVENLDAVECESGCGFWRGNKLTDGKCPECGDDTHSLPDDYFDNQ